ncbi:MAG: nuclear transport factor 2 family protein [Gammaproteobacteria bacterium]|nr:nuclear transport factor 2 family protein [Gammaproteobacteria bacterium]
MTFFPLISRLCYIIAGCLAVVTSVGQERLQYQYWQELAAADQRYADRAIAVGRNQAFLEFLGEDSVIFRDGPLDALAYYSSPDFSGRDLTWEAHYIDVSRAGDLGLSAGPLTIVDPDREQGSDLFGHLISVWVKQDGQWKLAADMAVFIPGFLSLEVEPAFADTLPVFQETLDSGLIGIEVSTMQRLIEADKNYGRSINIRGGERALLRYGMENIRVYLPGMGPAIGADVASSVYGAFLDGLLETLTPLNLNHMGSYLSESGEMGFTYGIMATNPEEVQQGFNTNYLRLWRLSDSNEWRIAVEVLRPFGE